MKIRQAGMDALETRRGGGCFMVFGFPFFAAGIFVIGMSLGLWAQKGDVMPWYLGIPFGGVFATVGAALMFGRAGVRIDRTQRTITTWWGLLVPFKKTVHPLGDYTGIGITREVRRSKNSTYTVYPVRLLGGEKPVDIGEPRNYEESRRDSEQLSKFLNWPVVDTSTGREIVREAGTMDESIRQRARRTGETVEVPDPPPGIRTQCEIEGYRIVLDLPRAGVGAGTVGAVLAALGIPAFFYFAFLREWLGETWDAPPPMNHIAIGVACLAMGLPFFGLLLAALRQAVVRRRVIASRDSLRVETRGLLFKGAREIPADELEELILPGISDADAARKAIEGSQMPETAKTLIRSLARGAARGVLARSDKLTLEFGKGLPPGELVWIHAVITRMMTV